MNRLGATQIMESYINYIMTIATDPSRIQPVHGIVPFSSLEESVAPDLKGFLGHGPVRIGNQAALQIQNDVYGSVVLAATQMFVDERLPNMGDESLFRLLERLGERRAVAGVRARRGPVGISRTVARRTPIRPPCAGPPAIDSAGSRAGSESPTAQILGRLTRTVMRERILSEAWDEKRAR